MTTLNTKRVRILSSASDSDDVDQEGSPNTQTSNNGEACRGKMQNLGQNKEGDTENGLKSKSCFVCDGEDNWVLICYGADCPVAIHQSCTSDEPDFDEFGNFFCPYCWYKRVLLKFVDLRKKLMVPDRSRKGIETLVRVDLGLLMDKETEDVENVVVEDNVSGGGTMISVNPSGNIRDCDGSDNKCLVLEKNQKMKEVAVETCSRGNSKADDADVDEGRQQRGQFSERNHESLDAVEGRKGRAIGSVKTQKQVPAHSSDLGENRKQQRRCDDINHETAQAHSIDEQRRYSKESQQNQIFAGTHKQDVFINDEGTQRCDSDLGEGRNGQGCCHEKNQQKKVSSTGRREQEVPGTNKRVLYCSGFGERKYQEGNDIEENHHTETVETETQEEEVSKDRKRKWEGGAERDGDEFYLAENQDRQCQADMRNDDLASGEQGNCFSKVEQVEENSVSSISSPESSDNVSESNAASQDLALIIHPMAAVQAQPIEVKPLCSVSSKKPSFQPAKYGHKSYLEKNETASNDRGQSDRKRKRLFWTQAEEEMLRVGVQKFPGAKNIPWRKILEFGRDVFRDERVPSDLKDKWKTLNKVSFDDDGSNNKCLMVEKNHKMKEVAVESRFWGNSKADDADVDDGRQQLGKFSERNHESLDAGTSNVGEGRKGRARDSVKSHEQVPARNSDVGVKRKQQRRCDDVKHETAQVHGIDVGVKIRKVRRYSEKNQQNKRFAGTHEQDVFINDEGTQSCDSDLGEGRNGQGCCHENNQQKKVSSTEIHEQEVPRTNKRALHGSGFGKRRYREGKHVEKKHHTETVETETQKKEASKDRKRKWERVERDGNEFYLAENQDRQCQADVRNDDVVNCEQDNGFRKDDEQVERNPVSLISSPESSDNCNESNAASPELAMIIHPMADVQAQPLCFVSSKKPSFQPEKYGHKSYLEKKETESNDRGQRKIVSCSDRKRKRLFWTQAEEEMLRVGVQKFPGVRNIPWRKILEFGRDVFHDERAPSDLKDKWKTMNKVSFDAGK